MSESLLDRRATSDGDRRIPADMISDRRHIESTAVLVLVQQVHDTVQKLDTKLTQHMDEETDALAQSIAKLMESAFPEGDPHGHRKHHELVIQQAEAKTAFWNKMRDELFKYGLLGFAGWACFALWRTFLMGPK